MKLSLNLVENTKSIEQEILKALLPECEKYMNNVMNNLKKHLPDIVTNAITSQPEYSSLLSGKLKFEFGIPDAGSKITNIINHWISNTVYDYKPPIVSSSGIRASFSAKLIRSNFSDILGTPDSMVSDTLRGYDLPWLEWLLLDGTAIIVPKYEVMMGSNTRSRTGYAVMVSSKESWKVPDEFSGTIDNNWITRAISGSQNEIQNLLNRIIQA
jgi:hypothetical protein